MPGQALSCQFPWNQSTTWTWTTNTISPYAPPSYTHKAPEKVGPNVVRPSFLWQEEKSGCALACTAMLLRISYKSALELFIEDDPNFLKRKPSKANSTKWKGPNHAANLERVGRVLKKNGLKIKKTKRIEEDTEHSVLIKFPWEPGEEDTSFHCVILYKKMFYDPSNGNIHYRDNHLYVRNFRGSDEPALIVSKR